MVFVSVTFIQKPTFKILQTEYPLIGLISLVSFKEAYSIVSGADGIFAIEKNC